MPPRARLVLMMGAVGIGTTMGSVTVTMKLVAD